MPIDTGLARAAAAIRTADALLITAGAGMGVDSGLPDFRGNEGFWRAYPAYAKLGLRFAQLANPDWFRRDPTLAWGFYGHRLNLYRNTNPHPGFDVLRAWSAAKPHGAFVFTSNVDGHFHKAGFDAERIVECHGSIHHSQCLLRCDDAVRSAERIAIDVDPVSFRATSPLPACPSCGSLERPNVLMFGDGAWLSNRTDDQSHRLHQWLAASADAKLTILEFGAGNAVPTVRMTGEEIADRRDATLIRVNPREPAAAPEHISLPLGALAAIEGIDRLLR